MPKLLIRTLLPLGLLAHCFALAHATCTNDVAGIVTYCLTGGMYCGLTLILIDLTKDLP